MDNEPDIPNIQGYVSIKEAAKILGLSTKRVYEYVMEGRLSAVRAVNALMIPKEEVLDFKPKASGRERKVTPLWRFSSGNNTQFMTSITVQIKPGQEKTLNKHLEDVKKSGHYLFPGTIARYLGRSEISPDRVTIILIWRGTVMPDEATREQELAALRQIFDDVLDWQTAQYDSSEILMHT